jgi:membrane protein
MDPPTPRPRLQRLRSLVALMAARVGELALLQTAASLAFLSLLALVPVFTIAISLLGASPVFAPAREALLQFLSTSFFLPGFSQVVLKYLNQFAAKAGQLSLIGGLAFFATAFSALLTINRTLNRIWRVRRPRPLVHRLTLYWVFLTLGPLVFAISIAVNAQVAAELFAQTGQRSVQRAWLSVLPLLASMAVLTLLYRLVPHATVAWRHALVGALLGAVALELLRQGLALLAVRLPTYTVVYGAFAALPLFLVWLMLVWLAVLLAAVLVACLPAWSARAAPPAQRSPAAVFARAAGLLQALARARSCGEPALRAASLHGYYDGDASAADADARLLSSLGYLQRHWQADEPAPEGEGDVWREWWLLRTQVAALGLRPLFEHCWQAVDLAEPPMAPSRVARDPVLAALDLDAPLVSS